MKNNISDWSLLFPNKDEMNNRLSILENGIGETLCQDSESTSLIERARKMRKEPTEAESILWKVLKNKNLGVKIRRQHPIGDYIVDFVDLKSGTIIEVDGGYHNDFNQQVYDEIRTNVLMGKGYTVIRFTNEEVINSLEKVISCIKTYISSKNNV